MLRSVEFPAVFIGGNINSRAWHNLFRNIGIFVEYAMLGSFGGIVAPIVLICMAISENK